MEEVTTQFPTDSWHITVLKNELRSRQSVNPRYSLRSFSRLIGVAPAVLSEVFRGKRKLPPKYAEPISGKLNFSLPKKKLFVRSVMLSKGGIYRPDELFASDTELSSKVLEEEIHSDILSQWEYYAVLSLFNTKDFESSESWVAERLGLEVKRAVEVISRLEQVRLIEKKGDGTWVRTYAKLNSSVGKRNDALRLSHKQTLAMASEVIDEVPLSLIHI